jgi:hypothetical protein
VSVDSNAKQSELVDQEVAYSRPVEAGIQAMFRFEKRKRNWMPVFTGMTNFLFEGFQGAARES